MIIIIVTVFVENEEQINKEQKNKEQYNKEDVNDDETEENEEEYEDIYAKILLIIEQLNK